MSTENYLRTETVHIDEVSCKGTSTVQWFAENKNKKGSATHPITHNNKLSLHICGKEGFAAIAKDIQEAKGSIDLVCWGFDPGMELLRNEYKWIWPRSETYGDLLIAAGRRGVQVRLLVWYSYSGGKMQEHMPGHTHGTNPWRREESDLEAQKIHAKRSLQLIQEHARDNRHKKEWNLSATGSRPWPGRSIAAAGTKRHLRDAFRASPFARATAIQAATKNRLAMKRENPMPSRANY
jgi:phosphatidylserine/phosphatidylglycerophosphate/cardiolipin synthase-like enzyme